MISAEQYLAAGRVPHTVQPQRFGLWSIERRKAGESVLFELGMDIGLPFGAVGWPDYTILRRQSAATIHLELGEVVMEDSRRELRKHLPIWMAAKGRVLKTGLGLGCVVRGLLINPAVEHIDVVEIDPDICRVIGPEFLDNPRVTIHLADALTWDFGSRRWDYAWHDLHAFDDDSLQLMHGRLLVRYMNAVADGRPRRQGAWAFPRGVGRLAKLIGAPR